MKMSTFFTAGSAKICGAAAVGLVTIFGLSNTTAGQQFFAQIGISAVLAETTAAAGQMAEKGSNAVQAFLGRSPGERGATDILKGKAKRDLAQNDPTPGKSKPSQKALGKIFDEPLQSLAGPISPTPVIEFLPLDAGSTAQSIPGLALAAPIGSGVFSPFIGGGTSGGGSIGGGGNGGGSGGGDGFVPPAPPPIAAAVPEPSTWILLLMGFAAVGASIRRTNRCSVSGSDRVGNCVTA